MCSEQDRTNKFDMPNENMYTYIYICISVDAEFLKDNVNRKCSTCGGVVYLERTVIVLLSCTSYLIVKTIHETRIVAYIHTFINMTACTAAW